MSFDDVMSKVMQWSTAAEALAALGAELQLQQPGTSGHPEIVARLRAVSTAAGLSGLDQLPPPQQAMVAGMARMFLHQANDLVDEPGRAPGWVFTDPAILDGWGRGSSMLPNVFAQLHPDLGEVTGFLDVGVGVGLLAIAAANVWPNATVVGIDTWDASLDRARANVAAAGLDDRITLRQQDFAVLDDEAAFDCIWIPTFFLDATVLETGLEPAVRALLPGGWVVLGRNKDVPDPLADAVAKLRWARGGGGSIDGQRATELLEKAGCHNVHIAQPPGPMPMEFVLGQRPEG